MKYLTIIEPDRPGLLAEITSLLELHGIDLEDFNGHSEAGSAVISILCRRHQEAFRLLSEAGFRVIHHEHVLVRLEQAPGALARLSRVLANAQVDVQGLHIVSRQSAGCIVALETTQLEKARQVLAGLLVVDVPGNEK